MYRLLVAAAVVGIAIGTGPRAFAQFGAQERYGSGSVNRLVDRVHEDLDHAYRAARFSDSDRDRLNDAEKKLREFASKWNRGQFDKDELDDSISRLQHVLDNNRLQGRERDALSDDVSELRNMRQAWDHHEIAH